MHTKIVLNPNDIKKLVMKHFEVEAKDVWVHCYTDTIGCGLGEHDEPTFEVVITKDTEQKI